MIGSRYVPGGGVTDWGPMRRFISRGGSSYARIALGLPVRDLTGGFKCFRREVLEAINLDTIEARGYAFQVETTYRAHPGRLPGGRDPDRLPGPRRRHLEDEPVDRRRGDVARSGNEIPALVTCFTL